MGKMQVEYWKTERLIPYEKNPRKNDPHVDRMVGAIREFGFRIPVVAKSDGTIIDGHLRFKAALKMGLKEVPVVLADELSEEQVKAFRILANKSVSWSDWDAQGLVIEFDDLARAGIDLGLTGFEDHEISEIQSVAAIVLSGESPAGIDSSRMGKGKVKIKAVLTGEYIDLFERAMDATKQMNRAEALKQICEAYLGKKG